MKRLSDADLWKKVKRLQGCTVSTIAQQKPNHFLQVTDNEIIIKNRKTRPEREEIINYYRYLRKHHKITKDDLPNIPGNAPLNLTSSCYFSHKVASIIQAILVPACINQYDYFVEASNSG